MRWMWIDAITEFEPETRLVAVKNVSLSEDHIHDHFPEEHGLRAMPLMPNSLIVEGMAQTAGILVGSVNRFREKVVLAKITRASIERDVIPGRTIRYTARLEQHDAAGAATSGSIEMLDHATGQWSGIGRVDLVFSHIDQNMSGMEFPEHNFVFSDNFRNILHAAGLEDLCD